jgi:hypothetical protein
MLELDMRARPFCSARLGSTVSQLGSAMSGEVRKVATEKMLRCMEVTGCKPTLLVMVTRKDRRGQRVYSLAMVMWCIAVEDKVEDAQRGSEKKG